MTAAEEEPSRAAGACVLVVLGGGVDAVVWAVSPEAGALSVWVVGVLALWRSARRKGPDLPLPSPTETPTRSDVYAVETGEAARVVRRAGGVTIYPALREVTPEEDPQEVS